MRESSGMCPERRQARAAVELSSEEVHEQDHGGEKK
jgi:hypothetical protein